MRRRALCLLYAFGLVATAANCHDSSSGEGDGGAGGDSGLDGGGSGADGSANLDGAVGDGGGDNGDGGSNWGGDAATQPVCLGVMPEAVSSTVANELTVVGARFPEGGELHLEPVETGSNVDLGPLTVGEDGESASVTMDAAEAPPGLYAVVLTLGTRRLVCRGSLLVSSLAPPTVTEVVPPFAWEGSANDGELSDEVITIVGEGFYMMPSVRFVSVDNPRVVYEAMTVTFLANDQLNAVVPSETLGMPVGDYYVYVVNPNGLQGQWMVEGEGDELVPGIFEVTNVPPPRIDSIDPPRSPAAQPPVDGIEVTGAYFGDGVVVSLGMPDGTRLDLETTRDETSPTTVLHAIIPAGLAQGPYPVYVTNSDGRHDVYYSYDATPSSSGHWGDIMTSNQELETPRWRHAVEYGFDVFGRAYIYAVAGMDDEGAILDDTEVLNVSVFGDLARPFVSQQYGTAANPRIPNLLNVARHGLTVVRVGRSLYAIGGADQDTTVADNASAPALSSVERAVIMGHESMPLPILPTAEGGNGLPMGTWYYQVSALGARGESLPSREVQVRNESGRITFCWHPVDGATGYNVYRNFDGAGVAGSTRLLAANVRGATCYEDTGRGVNQPAPSRLRGEPQAGTGLAVGYWIYRVTAVVGDRETVAGNPLVMQIQQAENGQPVLRWSRVPGATYNLYRTAAAANELQGDERTALLVSGLATNEYTDDGTATVNAGQQAPDGTAPLPPGSLTRWQLLTATPLNVGREGLDGVAITVPNGEANDNDQTFIYVTGGRDTGSGVAGDDYLKSTERAPVLADGTLGPWVTLDASMDLRKARAFFVLLTNIGQRSTPMPPPPEEPPCGDLDGDGHDEPRCGDDCDDTDPTIYPGAPEICGDGIDQDCNGTDPACGCEGDPDADEDGHLRLDCGGDDCNDSNPSIYPGAPEICGDGIDQDCNGSDLGCTCPTPVDQDNDGFTRPECGGPDCDDNDQTVFPGALEVCEDGIDQNCDGRDQGCLYLIRGSDGDGPVLRRDPTPPASWPGELPPGPRGYASVAEGPIYLIACQGDEEWPSGQSSNGGGSATMEVAEVASPSGDLVVPAGEPSAWTIQAEDLGNGNATHGHGALLYFDYLFVTPGVQTESRLPSVTPMGNTGRRFTYLGEPEVGVPARDQIFGSRQSHNVQFHTARAYYGLTRLMSFVYAIGGHDGTGALGSIERVHQ